MSAWPNSRETRRRAMTRHLAAALYLTATVSGAYLIAALAVLPFHGTARTYAFTAVVMSVSAVAGALTPRRATPYTREDGAE